LVIEKRKKRAQNEWAISTICIFRDDTPHTASAHHALALLTLFFLFLLYHIV
jgi:hypothetical protein